MTKHLLIVTDKYPIDPERSPAAWMHAHLRSLEGVADVTVVSIVRMLPRLKNLFLGGYDRRWFRILCTLPREERPFPHVIVHHRRCITLPDSMGWRINPRLYLWQQSRWLRGLLRVRSVDAVVVHYLHAATPLARFAATQRGVPLWLDENETLGSMRLEGLERLHVWLVEQLGTADTIIAQCLMQAAQLKQLLPEKSVHLIPLAVDDPLPAADPPIPPPLHCVCISRLDLYSKHVEALLHALALVRDADGPELRLTVAGDGYLLKEYRRLTRKLDISGAVHFAGWLPPAALQRTLRDQHLAIQPSQHESFGLGTLEAAAAGLPLIAGAHAGVVPDLTALGVAVRPLMTSAPEEIAAAILEVYERHREMQRQALEARGRVRENYSWQTHAGAYAALLASLDEDTPGFPY